MEALDKALSRMTKKLDPRILKPVEVKTLQDIRKILPEFDPATNAPAPIISLNSQMEFLENGQRQVYQVSTPTRSKSKRDQILEGMDVVKRRLQALEEKRPTSVIVNGKEMQPAALGYDTDGFAWVDPLIKQWLGAYRKGLMICWDLKDDYHYQYDIYTHKLSRMTDAGTASGPT